MNRKITDAATGAVTLASYLRELVANSWRHGAELIFAMSSVIAVVFITLWMRSWLHLRALGGPWLVMLVLLPPIVAVLLLETGMAAWRLHRRQRVALATRQTLLDLNAADRVELERHLLARYRRRERRIGARNEARVERLNYEIESTEAAGVSTEDLYRSDDDGWPAATTL